MNKYDTQANDFLEKTNTEIKIEFLKVGDHFKNGVIRDIYNITLKKGLRQYVFKFGQSVDKSGFYAIQGRRKTILDRALIGQNNLLTRIRYLLPIAMIQKDEIHFPVAPTNYDILACLTKYPVDIFEDFCREYGYDTDSRKAKKTFKAVKKEWDMVRALWSDTEIEMLQEIN